MSLEDDLVFYLENHVSKKRFSHILGTLNAAEFLCEKFGVDPYAGRIAALGHDLTREDFSQGKEQCRLYHGYSGAEMLKKRFGVKNESILNAVKYHTAGKAGMDDLGKIVYISDYIELGRTHLDDAERRMLLCHSLDGMMYKVVSGVLAHLVLKRKFVLPETVELYYSLKKKVVCFEK